MLDLKEFKLALIQEDIALLDKLVDNIKLANIKDNLNDLEQLKALLEESIGLVNLKKDEKAVEIQKFQKALRYLQ